MARVTSSDVAIAIINDETLKDRFFRYFDDTGPDNCWIWKGAKKKIPGEEYGITTTKRVNNLPGKTVSTSRLALFFKTHLWPSDKIACHTCNNPSCVNPSHLYWGTDEDNIWDSVASGTHHQVAETENGRIVTRDYSIGRKSNRRLYKNDIQRRIIKGQVLKANKQELREIAEREGMSFGMVVAIKYGRTWKSVEPG